MSQSVWKLCASSLQDELPSQQFNTWIKPLQIDEVANPNELRLLAPNRFISNWVEEKFLARIKELVAHFQEGAPLSVVIAVGAKPQAAFEQARAPAPSSVANTLAVASSIKEATPVAKSDADEVPEKSRRSNDDVQRVAQEADVEGGLKHSNYLNTASTFATFVEGKSNQLGLAAARQVAENPGGAYNPLFIYGGVGLGKTHLMQAVGNALVAKNPNAKVVYLHSERFVADMVKALQLNAINDFKRYYRSMDALLIDDIQFFAGKERSQEEFFHTFNALYQAGKQLILTSDKPPKELTDVDDRLISRFQWGLTVDVQLPDYETRMAILQRKSMDEGFELPAEITEYIARHTFTSVRELEGSLISVIAKVSLDRRELTLDLAKEVVRGVTSPANRQVTIQDIIREVSEHYEFSPDILAGKTRKHEVVLARQMAMFLAKQYTQLSLKSIGANFGGRDHTTVLHSCQMIENYMDTDPTVKNSVEILRRKFN